MDFSKLVGRKELAEKFGVTLRTLDRWRNDKKMPFIKIGGTYKFDLEQIEKWIQNNSK